MGQLSAPTEGLKKMIVELQMVNDQLHKTNKTLTATLKEMMGEFNDRLGDLEKAEFGEVRGDFSKYLQKEEEDVQVSKVSQIHGGKADETVCSEVPTSSGPCDPNVPN
jgi:nucleoside diphosphate kinase